MLSKHEKRSLYLRFVQNSQSVSCKWSTLQSALMSKQVKCIHVSHDKKWTGSDRSQSKLPCCTCPEEREQGEWCLSRWHTGGGSKGWEGWTCAEQVDQHFTSSLQRKSLHKKQRHATHLHALTNTHCTFKHKEGHNQCVVIETPKCVCVCVWGGGKWRNPQPGFSEGSYVQSVCWYSVKMEDKHATEAGRGQQVERMNLIVCPLGRCWGWRGGGGGGGGGCLKLSNKNESESWHWAVHWQNNP